MEDNINRTTAGKLSDDVVKYVNMRIAAAKLAVVESLSKFFGNALRILIFVLFCTMAFMGFAVAFVSWLAEILGSVALASFITGAICLLIGLVVFLLKKPFINPMVKMFSGMIFRHRKKETHEDREV